MPDDGPDHEAPSPPAGDLGAGRPMASLALGGDKPADHRRASEHGALGVDARGKGILGWLKGLLGGGPKG